MPHRTGGERLSIEDIRAARRHVNYPGGIPPVYPSLHVVEDKPAAKSPRPAAPPKAKRIRVFKGICHPREPAPCTTHGRTTRRCIVCNAVRCWRCTNETHPCIHFEHKCLSCRTASNVSLLRNFSVDPSDTSIADVAQSVARFLSKLESGAWRVMTLTQVAARVDACRQFFLSYNQVLLPPMPTAVHIAWLVEARVEGDLAACKHGKVQYETVMKDVYAMSKWRLYYAALTGEHQDDPLRDAVMDSVFRWAKDEALVVSHKKDAAETPEVRDHLERLLHLGTFQSLSECVAIIIGGPGLARRAAAAAIHFRGGRLPTPVISSQQDLDRCPDTVHPFIDKRGSIAVRVVVSNEKNMTVQQKSTRVISDRNVTGIPFASILIRAINSLNLPPGPLCRPSRHASHPFRATDWQRLLDRYAKYSGTARTQLGMTSFRRWYAIELHAAGVSAEDIGALGYWWSGAAREYLSSMVDARLRLQIPRS